MNQETNIPDPQSYRAEIDAYIDLARTYSELAGYQEGKADPTTMSVAERIVRDAEIGRPIVASAIPRNKMEFDRKRLK